jgi:hypothetical protein
MNLQRISEFAENQEGESIFITLEAQSLARLTFGSFHPDRLFLRHRSE